MIIEKEKIGFNVEERDLIEPESQIKSSKFKVIFDTDNNRIVSVVSKSYTLVKHHTIINNLELNLDHLKYESKFRLEKNGARLFAEYKFPDITVDVGKADPVAMKIICRNSYDSSCAVRVSVGAFRISCENSLIPGTELFYFNKRHYGNMEMIRLSGYAVTAIDSFKNDLLPIFEQMRKKEISDNEAQKFFNEMITQKRFIGKDYKKIIETIYNQEVEKQESINMWTVYNILTFVITHHIAKKDYEKGLLFQHKVFNGVKAWLN
jgi:hypothetical protein